jgi:hypothetical protein
LAVVAGMAVTVANLVFDFEFQLNQCCVFHNFHAQRNDWGLTNAVIPPGNIWRNDQCASGQFEGGSGGLERGRRCERWRLGDFCGDLRRLDIFRGRGIKTIAD